jgi:hypothetical protein
MSRSDLESTVTAYFLATAASDINIAGRWFPKSDLVMMIDDKFQMAVRKFGVKARAATKPAAAAFVEHMIAKGGWTTKENDFGGTMHQWQMEAFRAELKKLQDSHPIVRESITGGETFWQDKFAAVTA